MSRFVLCRYLGNGKTDAGLLEVDEDGDMVVSRRFKKDPIVLQIEHAMATSIGDVGQQTRFGRAPYYWRTTYCITRRRSAKRPFWNWELGLVWSA